MTNEVARQDNDLMKTKFNVNGQEVKLSSDMVKSFLVNGNGNITDQEALMFISLCKYQHLNPFLKEAYLIKFGNSPAQQIVSKEAFMKRAEQNPHFKGMQAGCIVVRNNEVIETKGAFVLPKDELVGGWATVKRDDRDLPITVQISFNEFSKGQSTWKSMPANMIRKTAIVNCLREAFPNDLGAMYTEEDAQAQVSTNNVANTQNKPEPKQNVADLVNDTEPTKKPAKAKKMVKDVTPTESKEVSSTKAPQSTEKQPKDKMSEEEAKRAYETIKNGGIDDIEAEPDIEDDSKEQTSLFK